MKSSRRFLRADRFIDVVWTTTTVDVFSGLVDTLGDCRELTCTQMAEVLAAVETESEAALAAGFIEEERNEEPDHASATVADHVRQCARPIASSGANADRGSESHFGGTPLLAPGEPWPRCVACAEPLTFLVQIALEEVPLAAIGLPERGLVQIFACDRNCYDTLYGAAWTGMHLVRIVDAAGRAAATGPAPELPARSITRWDLADDVPAAPELALLLGITEAEAFETREELNARGYVPIFEKVGGWPCWAQSAEHVECRCGHPMDPVLQLETATVGTAVIGGLVLNTFRCGSCAQMTLVCQR